MPAAGPPPFSLCSPPPHPSTWKLPLRQVRPVAFPCGRSSSCVLASSDPGHRYLSRALGARAPRYRSGVFYRPADADVIVFDATKAVPSRAKEPLSSISVTVSPPSPPVAGLPSVLPFVVHSCSGGFSPTGLRCPTREGSLFLPGRLDDQESRRCPSSAQRSLYDDASPRQAPRPKQGQGVRGTLVRRRRHRAVFSEDATKVLGTGVRCVYLPHRSFPSQPSLDGASCHRCAMRSCWPPLPLAAPSTRMWNRDRNSTQ